MKNLSRVALAAISCLLAIDFAGATEKIDINVAPLADLIKIIHIGEARAQELISLRPFSSLDDLDRIKGIGVKRIKDIKAQGLAWVGAPVSLPKEEIVKKEAAAVGEQTAKPSSLLVFLVAAVLAVFSGTTVLFLKKGIK